MNKEQQQQQVPLYCISPDAIERNEDDGKVASSFLKTLVRQLRVHSGIWYMLMANFIFSSCTFALKLIPADMFDIMIARFLFQSIVFGSFASFYKHYNVFHTNGQPLACILNIFMSSLTSLTYLGAFYFIPLSDLNTIKYTSIVWAAILSVIFLKDHFKLINGIALVLTCIGFILATKPHLFVEIFIRRFFYSSLSSSLSSINMTVSIISTTTMSNNMTSSPYYYVGIILASISALAKAIQMIARKQLVKTKLPYSVMNFHFTGGALLVCLIYSMIRRFWQPGPYPWKWMASVGVFIGCCHLFTNTFVAKALKRESVQLLAIVGSTEIVFAVLLQLIFLHQTKSWIFYIGASLIVLSAVLLSIDRHMEIRREREQQVINDKQADISNNL